MGRGFKNSLPGKGRPQLINIRQTTELLGLRSPNYLKRFYLNREGFPAAANSGEHKNPDFWLWNRAEIIQFRDSPIMQYQYAQQEATNDAATA